MLSSVPRRSMLFVPGSNARALEKAAGLPADAVILDLEDAVLPSAKTEARHAVLGAVRSGRYGAKEVVVRVNPVGTPWSADDLSACAKSGAHALLLPKVESPETLRSAEAALEAAGAPTSLRLMAMIETPLGVADARLIAESSPRLEALVVGPNDLEATTGARQTADRTPMLTMLSLIVLAARVAGCDVIDGIFPQLNDEEGFRQACRQGVELGFDGKTLIHPKQILPANAHFGPSPEAVAEARQVLAAFAEAEAKGQGVALLNGRMVEALHVEMARRTVAFADAVEDRG